MASELKKSQKAGTESELAMKAVEDALNEGVFDDVLESDAPAVEVAETGDIEFDPDFEELERKLSLAANDLRLQSEENSEPLPHDGTLEFDMMDNDGNQPSSSSAAEQSRAQEPFREFLAANDQRSSSLSELVHSLQQRSSSRAYVYAFLISVVWLGVCAGLYFVGASNGSIAPLTSIGDLFNKPSMVIFGAILLVPLAMIWTFATIMRRSQEMRVATRTMTEAAIRLLQPEVTGAESVSMIGTAVRREVASIGDGVERALARAGELESLVSSEVGSLERSYADAEVRLKGLVSELAAERAEIIGHVEMLRQALSGTHEGIGHEVDKVAGRIEQSVQNSAGRIVESLSHEASLVTDNLESVTNRLASMLQMNGSELAQLITLRTDELDRVLAERSNIINEGVAERLTGFGAVLDGKIHSAFDRLSQQQETLDQTASRIDTLVSEKIGKLTSDFGNRGATLVRALGMQAENIDKLLAEKSDALGSIVNQKLEGFGHNITGHMDTVAMQLKQSSAELESTTVKVEQALLTHVTRFDQSLRDRAMDVGKAFTAGKNVLSETIEDAFGSISQKALETKLSLEEVQTSMINAMDERVAALTGGIATGRMQLMSELDNFDDRSKGIIAEIARRTDAMGDVVSDSGGKLSAMLQEHTDSIRINLAEGQQRLVAELDKMENRSTGLVAEIDKRTERMGAVVTAAGNSLTSTLDERTVNIQKSLADGQQRIVAELDKMENRSTGLVAEIDKRSERMGALVTSAGNNLTSALDERTKTIQQSLSEGQQRIVSELDRMNDSSSGLVAELDKRAEHIGEILSVSGQKLTSAIDTRTQTIQSSLAEGQLRIVHELDRMNDSSSGLVAEIDKRAENIGSILSASGERLTSAIDVRALSIQNSLAEGQQRIVNELDRMNDSSSGLVAELDKRAELIGLTINEAGKALTTTLDKGAATLGNNILGGMQKITAEIARLDDKGAAVLGNFDERTNRLSSVLDTAAEHIGTVFDEKNQNIFATFRAGRDEFLADVSKGSSDLLAGLDEKRGALVTQLNEHIELTGQQIDKKAAALSTLLSERAREINSTLGSELLEAQQAIEEKTKEFSASLAERMRELSGVIADEGLPFVEQLRSGTSSLVSQIEQVGVQLSTEIGGLIARLGTSSAGLDENIQRAGQSLRELEKNITDGAATLAESVERASINTENARQVAEHTAEAVSENSEYLLQNMSSLAIRFENQGKELRDAAQLVTNAQVSLAEAIDTRREPVERLAADLTARTMNLEKSMDGFSSALAGLMNDMTEKASAAGANLNHEVRTAFEQTLARLSETAAAMRQSTAEINQELEYTRTQMKRGILELPEEVTQSADTMRRVLVDQMSALRELSEIVTRSGKTLDIAAASTPARSGYNRPAEPAAPRRPSAPAFISAPPTAPVPQPAPPPQRAAAPVAPAPARAPAPDIRTQAPHTAQAPQGRGEPRGGLRLDPLASGTAEKQAERPRDAGGEKSGWVSDLLRRASSEDDAELDYSDNYAAPQGRARQDAAYAPPRAQSGADNRSPLHVVESLNSLSMDIARAIDHEASVELWDRYQRGERNVFTRRLYTLQGQQTFDEIRSKYAREREFRSAVDRYIADFERLLKDVSKNDRDNIMTQTYLTSDTGKVYTMLAHAAGKLGS